MSLSQNSFFQVPVLGQLDLSFNSETVSALVDISITGGSPLVAGEAVILVDNLSGVPTVTKCTASGDAPFGFIVFDRMHPSFTGGQMVEISQGGTMYLNASEAVGRGAELGIVHATPGDVALVAGHTGVNVVGYAFDKSAAGGLIRVKLNVPSFKTV